MRREWGSNPRNPLGVLLISIELHYHSAISPKLVPGYIPRVYRVLVIHVGFGERRHAQLSLVDRGCALAKTGRAYRWLFSQTPRRLLSARDLLCQKIANMLSKHRLLLVSRNQLPNKRHDGLLKTTDRRVVPPGVAPGSKP